MVKCDYLASSGSLSAIMNAYVAASWFRELTRMQLTRAVQHPCRRHGPLWLTLGLFYDVVSFGTGRRCLFATSVLGALHASVRGGIDVFWMGCACWKDGQGGGGTSHSIVTCSRPFTLGAGNVVSQGYSVRRLDWRPRHSFCEVPKRSGVLSMCG